jgi:hypothetical protein
MIKSAYESARKDAQFTRKLKVLEELVMSWSPKGTCYGHLTTLNYLNL